MDSMEKSEMREKIESLKEENKKLKRMNENLLSALNNYFCEGLFRFQKNSFCIKDGGPKIESSAFFKKIKNLPINK